jgi:hypothetical protein
MDSLFPFDDGPSNAAVIALIVVAFGIALMISGWSMKLACSFCGGPEIGILRGLTMAIACTIVSSLVMYFVNESASGQGPWIASLYGLFAATATLSLLLAQNPLRSMFTYIVYAVISGAFSLAAAAAMAAMIYFSVEPAKLQQAAKHYAFQSQVAPAPTTAMFQDLISPVQEVGTVQPAVAEPLPPKKKLPPGVKANPFVK